MHTPPFPKADNKKALGWHITNDGVFWHNGATGGGAAYMAKYSRQSGKSDTLDLSDVNVAICANIKNTSGMSSLTRKIAQATVRAGIPTNYDLFDQVTP